MVSVGVWANSNDRAIYSIRFEGHLSEVESAFRKISYTVLLQLLLLYVTLMYLMISLPWEDFRDSEEHLDETTKADDDPGYSDNGYAPF